MLRSPLFDLDNWREIGVTLSRNKTRTFLTAFGIFWGVAMLAMLWGGAKGLEGMMMRNFQGFATNMGFLAPARTTISYKGYNKGMEWSLEQSDVNNIRRLVDGIEASSGIAMQSTVVAYGTQSAGATSTVGVEEQYADINLPVIHSGRFINAADLQNDRKVVVLGKNVATKIFGTADPVGKFVSLSGIYFHVVGVASQKGEASIGARIDDSVIMPLSTMRRAYAMGNDVGFFIFNAKQGTTPTKLMPSIRRILRTAHPIHPDDDNAVHFFDVSEQFAMVNNLFTGISVLALFVGIGTLLAGIIGVGNIMWIIVKERTNEIGVRRAIGARPAAIVMQILCEGVALTIIAGVLGLSFAVLVLYFANTLTTDPTLGEAGFGLSLSKAIGIMLAFIILGTAAGLIPALKSLKIKPVEALNAK